ncbi:conserved hypothetical protein [Microsporum canis CBS 113480]|uniref:Uncharacterized protein n=1 Tax=Arthroderma otae (strain ATCC MYA-4605 / CBS 113480) TaxID=554155 RepID=C5FX92_ARTOC|nr:conserved hypothetical protein [Microsporum canis CBS 113480]EEQ34932.1 conserved hypothetical protein [Microsporum canis CBS 113480]
MFVYIDGVYQCNRNRDDLILRKPSGKVKKRTQNVNFCVRQKEERLTDGSWIGRPWRFEPLQIVQLMPGMPEINRSHFDNLGQICVVVLRCESPCDQYSSEGSLSPESAMAFGPNLDGTANMIYNAANPAYVRNARGTLRAVKVIDPLETMKISLVDTMQAQTDYTLDVKFIGRINLVELKYPTGRKDGSHMIMNLPRAQIAFIEDIDITGQVAPLTRYINAKLRTRIVLVSIADTISPNKDSLFPEGQRKSNLQNRRIGKFMGNFLWKRQCSLKIQERKRYIAVTVDAPLPLCLMSTLPYQHRGWNQKPTTPGISVPLPDAAQRMIQQMMPVISSLMTRKLAESVFIIVVLALVANIGSQATENQNYTTNETSWDQGQGDQGANGNPDDWNKNNSNSGSNMLGQQENPTSDNDNKSSGQDWLAQNMDSGNGDAPAAGWPSNNSNDNGRNNYNSQHAPLTSPNNGYSNPQQVPSSPPPPPIIPAQAQGPMWETPPPIQRVHTLITPFCQGPEASEPPLYTVPEQVAQERSLSHQVQVGKSSIYSHKIKVPQYIDTMEEPYAKFVFKYRVKGVIESEIGKSIERDVEAERKLLESLPREEILNQLLHAQGLLAAQALGQPLTVPYQVQQHQRTNSRNQQYAPVQQQSSPPSNINNHNQRSQPGPTHWNSAPAQEELLTVPSKLTGYNDRSINAPQSPQNGNWAAKLTAGLQDVQQQQQNGSNHSNDAAPAWNAQAGQDEAGTKW